MRPIRSLLIYLLAVFVGGALLAPWLYWLVQEAAQSFPSLQSVAANPFHRFVNRSLIIIAVVGLWPMLRSVGIRSWADAGLGSLRGQGRSIALGLGLGFGSLALVAAVGLMMGARRWNDGVSGEVLLKHVFNAGMAAVFVSIAEELVFRGALFGGLRKACRWPVALVWSSVVYALVHFFHRVEWTRPVEWTSGLVVLGDMLGGMVNVGELVPGFLSLTLVGAALALGYQRTGTLYLSMGLHAGWIFWLKSYGFFTTGQEKDAGWFWGSGKLLDGWLVFVMLALTVTCLFRWSFGAKTVPDGVVNERSK